MSTSTKTAGASTVALRWALILMFALLAFFASYRFAIARSGTSTSTSAAPLAAAAGGGCCGGASAPAGSQKPAAATIAGSVQKITVDTTKGYYNPATIQLKAGIPAEITFTQSSGCLAQVQSQDLGFSEDLTGGPKTIKLGALKAGTYSFACGMNMQSGSIVVK